MVSERSGEVAREIETANARAWRRRMKPMILARLEKVYRSIPASMRDDDQDGDTIMNEIALRILNQYAKAQGLDLRTWMNSVLGE